MQRYFVPKEQFYTDHAVITGPDVHHIRTVMRMNLGDRVGVLDNHGNGYLSEIEGISSSTVTVRFIQPLSLTTEANPFIIAQALIKRDRFEWMLEKSTELGVHAIIPTVFDHSIIKLDDERQDKKLIRYQAIVKEASEQSRRLTIPTIMPVTSIRQLPFDDVDATVVCYEKEEGSNRLSTLAPLLNPAMKIMVLIGPEGGFSENEIAFLKTKNALFCSLGQRIVRSETASLMVLSYFNEVWGC